MIGWGEAMDATTVLSRKWWQQQQHNEQHYQHQAVISTITTQLTSIRALSCTIDQNSNTTIHNNYATLTTPWTTLTAATVSAVFPLMVSKSYALKSYIFNTSFEGFSYEDYVAILSKPLTQKTATNSIKTLDKVSNNINIIHCKCNINHLIHQSFRQEH